MGIFNLPVIGNIVAAVIMFGILVTIHEFGHFIMAKLFGVYVKTFSIGFGKKLFRKKWGETEYCISLIPLGGYVAMLGEEPDESEDNNPRNFNNKPKWQRLIILAMGATLNIILAVILFTIVNTMHKPVPVWKDKPVVIGWVDNESPAFVAGLKEGDKIIYFDRQKIKNWDQFLLLVATNPDREVNLKIERDGNLIEKKVKIVAKGKNDAGYLGVYPPLRVQVRTVMPGSPAEKAGIKTGDKILKVNGKPIVKGLEQFINAVKNSEGEINLTIERNGKIFETTVKPQGQGEDRKIGVIIELPYKVVKLPLGKAFSAAIEDTAKFTKLTFNVLGKLLKGEMSIKSISGPVDIARISGEAARSGIISFLYFMGLISLQLGIFNLLPIPMLDGGHIFILLIEAVRRKDLSPKLKEKITTVGFFLLITLMVLVIISDILKNLNLK